MIVEPPEEKPKRVRRRHKSEAQRRRDEETGRYASKLTPAVQEKLINALKGGAPVDAAAAYAGIARSTWYEWMRVARGTDPPAILVELMEAVDEAIATFVVGATMTMTRLGAEGNPRALEFQLERRFPDWYGRRTVIEHGNLNGQAFKVEQIPMFDPELLTEEELEQVVYLLRKARPAELPVIEA